MIKNIVTPLSKEVIESLSCGDSVTLTGYIYTARDAAHKRLCELIEAGKDLPFDIKDQVIFFAGPAPAKPGLTIGSVGPTTSYRMDAYSPLLIRNGLAGMVGKGSRGAAVVDAMKECGAVYFCAIGGCAALLAKCVKSSETVCYEDLGTEAVRKLYVEDMPLTVAIDCRGDDIYQKGKKDYLDTIKEKQDGLR